MHGWGTLRGSGPLPVKVWLEGRYQDGRVVGKIPVMLGQRHEDAANASVGIDFVIYGQLKDPASSQDRYFLVIEWAGDRRTSLAAPSPRVIAPTHWLARIAATPWKHYIARGIRLVRQGQSRLLVRKLVGLSRALLSSGWDPRRLLKSLKSEQARLALVIDHDLGGGANLYRQSLMRRLASDGLIPVLLTAHHGVLAYQLSVTRGKQTSTAYAESLDALFDALPEAGFERVIFNNIVSFPEPLAFVSALTNWVRQEGIGQFLFLMHDHYCMCPSWLLLDDKGKYCGIPDTAVCASCLPANAVPFLEFAGGVDIVSWRAAWGALLNEASEIRCFSGATRTLLIRAHGELDPGKITVVPHTLEHVQLRKIGLKDAGWPVIGIVGAIVPHKGEEVVRGLAEHIQLAGAKARIVIIGTIEGKVRRDVATVTGPYLQQQLPDILEAQGVNVGFFPSIWPETFSYVAEEMMKMGLPLLAFDLGAPGERVSKYAFGEVIPPSSSPQAILESLERLYDKHVHKIASIGHPRP